MILNKYTPNPKNDLLRFQDMLAEGKAFTFVRFSDGEMEIIRNRYLKIGGSQISFRGANYKNIYPEHDSKTFDPGQHSQIRLDLIESAKHGSESYYIGIPTSHNKALIDRNLMVRLNGGINKHITFADIFINSNYGIFRKNIVPLFDRDNIHIVCNYRANFSGEISSAKKIPIGDNFFLNYEDTLNDVYSALLNLKSQSVVLSSASSLSNILGCKLNKVRQDITFIDVGTAMNYLMGMNANTRLYHGIESLSNLRGIYHYIRFRFSRNYNIRW